MHGANPKNNKIRSLWEDLMSNVGNVIAKVHLSLDIPEKVVHKFAKNRKIKLDDYQTLLDELERDVQEELSTYMDYCNDDPEVECDG